MIKKALPLLLISLFLLPLYAAADADPKVELSYPIETDPGKIIFIDVKLTNTTSEMLWDLKAVIDSDEIPIDIKNYINVIDGEKKFVEDEDHSINVQDQVTTRLSIEITANAEPGNYRIPLAIRGEIGNCRQGCKPYLLVKNIDFKVVKEFPSLKIELSPYSKDVFQGQDITIPFKISNYGEGYGRSIKVSIPENANYQYSFDINSISFLNSQEQRIVNLNILTKGDTPSGDYKTDIIVEYFDAYGDKKATTQSISFSVKDSAVVKNAENYYTQANTYFEKKNYSKALEFYQKSREAYQEVGLTSKVNEIDSKILLVNTAIEESKGNIGPMTYILFAILLSAVTMELGVLVGTLFRKPKSPTKKSSIPTSDY